jgi:hypothetical protein
MGLNPIINYAIRGAQLLFGIIVLGLSVDLIRGHEKRLQDLPATLGFAAFVGGISILGALVGVAANWVEILQSIIGAGIDGVIALINLIGGVVSTCTFFFFSWPAFFPLPSKQLLRLCTRRR